MGEILSLDDYSSSARPEMAIRSGQPQQGFFNRHELDQILDLYGDMVSKGEWRDYAIGQDAESCTFAVFRRSADGALYRITKRPCLAARHGAYAVISFGGRILRRGRSLDSVLRVFDAKRLRPID